MPKIERTENTENYYEFPDDIPVGVDVKVTYEWPDPEPENDWTPDHLATVLFENLNGKPADDYDVLMNLANQTAELEREECAKVAKCPEGIHLFNDWWKGYRAGREAASSAIRARTNDEAGYPRLIE